MKKFSLLVGGALGPALLALASCNAANDTAAHTSPPPAAPVAATNSTPPAPPATLTPASAAGDSHGHQAEEDNVPRVSGADAKRLADAKQAVIVDVRSLDAYDMGHAEGALHVPLDAVERGEFKNLPRNKSIITYCT
jgi:hypothetical protein